jgi:hypothetical protein
LALGKTKHFAKNGGDTMKKVGTPLRLTLCLSLLAAIALGFPTSTPAGAGPKPQDVNVVNTPLPVQGTVGVNNFPATQNVNVTNTTPVPVTPSGDPASNAFTAVSAGGNGTFDAFGSCITTPYSVASGKRLVIENVGAEAKLGTGQKLETFSIGAGTPSGLNQWAPTYQADDGTNAFFVASQAMRFYFDADTAVTMTAQASKSGDSGTCHFSFSGYLVNLP